MAALTWDADGSRTYETGISKGVLYPYSTPGEGELTGYQPGVAWNGLTSVTESPEGGDIEDIYADNIKYLALQSAETFKGTIEAYTYPDQWMECDGSLVPSDGTTGVVSGLVLGQQERKVFGFCYRTEFGNDTEGNAHGYKLHLVYGCRAAVSERQYQTINDSPEAITFSWEFNSTPASIADPTSGSSAVIPGAKPVSLITIDSTKVNATKLAALEKMLYGDTNTDPQLPLPYTVYATLKSST